MKEKTNAKVASETSRETSRILRRSQEQEEQFVSLQNQKQYVTEKSPG